MSLEKSGPAWKDCWVISTWKRSGRQSLLLKVKTFTYYLWILKYSLPFDSAGYPGDTFSREHVSRLTLSVLVSDPSTLLRAMA